MLEICQRSVASAETPSLRAAEEFVGIADSDGAKDGNGVGIPVGLKVIDGAALGTWREEHDQ